MTQFATDFSEYAVDAQPTDWTKRFNTSAYNWLVKADATAVTGGQILQCGPDSSQARGGLSWDLVDADPDNIDAEVFTRVRFPGNLSNSEIMVMFRGNFDGGAVTTYRHGYRPATSAYKVELARYANNSYLYMAGGTSIGDPVVGDWYNILTQTRGSTHRIKVWKEGNAEPASWEFETDDAAIATAGWTGFVRYRTEQVDVDFYGVGTGTDSAPRTAGPAAPSLSSPLSQDSGETGYSGSVNTSAATGTLYHVVTSAVTKPSVAQLKAGQDHLGAAAAASGSQSVTTSGVQNVAGTGLITDSTYYIHYYHEDVNGGSSVVTSPSFTVVSVVSVAPSNAPVIEVENVIVTDTSVYSTFTFDEASNSGDAATGFEVSVNGGAWTSIGNPVPQEFTVNSLTPETLYDSPGIQLRAVNATGAGPASTAIVFTTDAAPTAPTVAPVIDAGNLIITSTGVSGQFTFDSASNTGDTVTGYEIRLDNGSWTSLGNPSPKEFTISGLTSETLYNSPGLEMRALNAIGPGPVSSAVTFTTASAAAVPPTPINLSVSNLTATSAQLNWDPGV